MVDLFTTTEMTMIGLVMFSSLWIFLFNYRTDNKEKYSENKWLILFDLIINMGMSVTGYILISVVFSNVAQLSAYEDYSFPIGYLFGLTSNVSIPIVLKWFSQQVTKKLNQATKK